MSITNLANTCREFRMCHTEQQVVAYTDMSKEICPHGAFSLVSEIEHNQLIIPILKIIPEVRTERRKGLRARLEV